MWNCLWSDTGKEYNVQELKEMLQTSNRYIQTLHQESDNQENIVADKERSIDELESSLRQGIKRPYILYRNFYSRQKKLTLNATTFRSSLSEHKKTIHALIKKNESLEATLKSNKLLANNNLEFSQNSQFQNIQLQKSLQANINSKQQSINRLTTENRKQADMIKTLLLESTDKKSLENELKTLKTQLKSSTKESQLFKLKMENQRAELKNLNTKSNQVSSLNAEIAILKSQLDEKKKSADDAEKELNKCKKNIQQLEQEIQHQERYQQKKIKQLEQEIRGYEEILNDLDGYSKPEIVENQECAICCEIFSEERKRVAYGPCGHSMACLECSETMLNKTTVNGKGRNSKECPICRADIKSTIVLQGIY